MYVPEGEVALYRAPTWLLGWRNENGSPSEGAKGFVGTFAYVMYSNAYPDHRLRNLALVLASRPPRRSPPIRPRSVAFSNPSPSPPARLLT